MASIPTGNVASSSVNHGANYRGSFAIMTSLFFLWGFMTVFNDILIPRFKEAFTLNYTQAMFVQLAFFGAYFVGSLIYFLISMRSGDPIAKLGYKNGVVIGLLISATGAGLFWPAATQAPFAAVIASKNISNVQSLAQKLNHPTNEISIFVSANLSEPTRKLLAGGSSAAEPELKQAIAQDLNLSLIHI